MKLSIDRERVKVFLWIATAYLALALLRDLIETPETFFKRIVNNIWLISYLVVINFILFEYALPSIKLSWRRLLIAPPMLFGFLMLYSFGLFAWRAIGIAMGIYFELREYVSTIKGVEAHVAYSFASIFSLESSGTRMIIES